MIKAKHSRSAKFVFDLYLKRLLKSSFEDFYIPEIFPKPDPSKGLLVTPNHFSWWDGFFIYWLLNKYVDRKIYVMMLEEQLKRYWFFNYVGCYSINLRDVKSSISSLRYTLDILSDERNVVVIYPQGEIEPYEKRPLELKGGISFLSQNAKKDFTVLPAAFKIHYSDKRLPLVYSRFSEPINSNEIGLSPDIFVKSFTDNIDSIDRDFLNTKVKSIF